MSLVAWPTILKSKTNGGLGFWDLHLVNNAFGMKVCWELFTKPTSLWVLVLASKYKFDNEAGLNPIQPNSSSPLWRLVCKNWDDMMTNVAWIVENGKHVRFWEHIWVPGLDLPLIELAVSQVPDSMRFHVVASFMIALGEWEWQSFEYLLPSNAIQLIAAILSPDESMDNDRPFWCPSSSGCFTLKTTYLSLCRQRDVVSRAPWHQIWKWVGPQRIKVFMWLCLSNGVLTTAERCRRHLSTSNTCEVCFESIENTMHIIHNCRFARDVLLG
ncbi:hypothetical protein K2173_001454 [Erythroxylum novogranatense]|uniref:Reverse transcriptase zinc-binding domain-containing protein n=1 Tax=Erythroxylum novogranatense TaxID=1862640 RepID=A0AAV8T934_9ROSI|nr:hypothetical protein K2173_001454 [Erythroxylum novogranatense]